VLSNFASAPNGFVVNGINVQPAGGGRRRVRQPGNPANFFMGISRRPRPRSVGKGGLQDGAQRNSFDRSR